MTLGKASPFSRFHCCLQQGMNFSSPQADFNKKTLELAAWIPLKVQTFLCLLHFPFLPETASQVEVSLAGLVDSTMVPHGPSPSATLSWIVRTPWHPGTSRSMVHLTQCRNLTWLPLPWISTCIVQRLLLLWNAQITARKIFICSLVLLEDFVGQTGPRPVAGSALRPMTHSLSSRDQ